MTPLVRMPSDADARRAAAQQRVCDALEATHCALELLLATPLDPYQREIVWATLRLTAQRSPITLAAPDTPSLEKPL